MYYLGWVGAALVLFGYFLNAKKKKSSWLIWIVGNLFVAIYSWHIGALPTTLMSLAIMIMNIYGYISWKKEKKIIVTS